jgi:protein ImuB
LVVVERNRNALRLSAVDSHAEKLGLHVGQPLANARAIVPELDAVPANHGADATLLSHLADWCDRFTPVVALDRPDGLFLDIAGTSNLFGDDQKILTTVLQELRLKSFAVQGAIANTTVSARALAHYRDGFIAADNGEAKAVASLPVEALQLDPITTHAFRRAGLKTIGQVATRKRSEIVSRFGATTLARIDAAQGQSSPPITPRQPSPDYWKAQNFAEPIATLDVILSVLQSVAVELCVVMVREGVGARCLEARFYRADGSIRRIAVETGSPVYAAPIIIRLFQERLGALSDPLDPGFGFDVIRLAALKVERVDHAPQSLDANAQVQADIDFMVDRLAARFGRDHILQFQPHDTHVPDRAWHAGPALSKSQTTWQAIRMKDAAPRRPLRLFLNPEPVDVVRDPLRLFWRKVSRPLTQWEGPERIAMEWWRENNPYFTRDYFRAEDEAGKRYWIYRSTDSAQWFLHGLFT